jgi:tripartite-type tricarboxylate transporter receptor subunit TctC
MTESVTHPRERLAIGRLLLLPFILVALPVTASTAALCETSFRGKTITMLVGSQAGSGTDATGRAVARVLGKYLPGTPTVVVQNMPGANGVTAMNYFMLRTKPDGLTVFMGSNSIVDPLTYRRANAQYDPTTIRMVGGIGRGGTLVFISREAEKRLTDKSAAPVMIGNQGALPNPGMMPVLWGIEYLGWNAKWIVGYPGANEIMVALDRGEIDLSSTSNIFLVEERMKAGSLDALFQSGSVENGKIVGRAEFGNTPIFNDLIKGKITDPVEQEAFDYWWALNSLDKWIGLASGTPDEILGLYRAAFDKFMADDEFIDLGKKISGGFGAETASDAEALTRTLAGTSQEALTSLANLMRKQGLQAQ